MPLVLLLVIIQGAPHGIEQRRRRGRSELESGGGSCGERRRRGVYDAVRQSPATVDDGRRAVSQTVELIQAAWFEARWHEEQVAAGLDAMGQPFIETDSAGDISRQLRARLLKACFQFRHPGSQKCQLDGQANEFGQDVQNQIDSLLRNQPGDESQQRDISLNRQAHFGLKGAFDRGFSGQIVGIVVRGEVWIADRIPERGIDAIEHPMQDGPAVPEQSIKPFAQGWGLDFLGVGGADGAQRIGKDQPSLDQARLAVEFECIGMMEPERQTQFIQDPGREIAAILQIVNGEQHRLRHTFEQHPYGDQARLPVIGVDEVRFPGQTGSAGGEARCDAAKPVEALRVVGPVASPLIQIGVAGPVAEAGAVQ